MDKYLTLTLMNGAPVITDEKGTLLVSGLRVGITPVGTKSNSYDVWAQGDWTLEGTDESGVVCCASARIEYRREGCGLAMRSFYTHSGSDCRRSEKLIGLWGLWHCGFEKCLFNDFTSANGTFVNEMRSQVVTATFSTNQTLSGAENMALIDMEGKQIIAGYITFNHRFPCMDAGDEGKIVFWQQTENHPIAHGETLEGDWIYIGLCDDITTGLMDYARLAGRYMNSRAGIFDTPYGYCTWYYYGRGLCPETVKENMETLVQNRHRIQAKYFNLDNGWFKEWGDWTENEKFACGMKKSQTTSGRKDLFRAFGWLHSAVSPITGSIPNIPIGLSAVGTRMNRTSLRDGSLLICPILKSRHSLQRLSTVSHINGVIGILKLTL